MTVIAVGNGSSVLHCEAGFQVDAFDVVVRFNNFRTAGFEKYVGSRTTIWVRNPSPVVLHRDPALFEQILLFAPDDVSRESYLYSIAELRQLYPSAVLLPNEIVEEIHRTVRMPLGFMISSGLAALVWLNRRYGHVKVHGFDHFQTTLLHYFSDKTVLPETRHQADLEAAYFHELERSAAVSRLEPDTSG